MRFVLALMLVVFVYVGIPAGCLAATDAHACACADESCPSNDSGESGHECHDDPCPDPTLRPEGGDQEIQAPQRQFPVLGAWLDPSSHFHSFFHGVDAVLRQKGWQAAFAIEGLPLLI